MYSAVVLLPLLGSALAGLFLASMPAGHGRDRAAQLATCLCMAGSAVLSIVIFYEVAFQGQGRTIEVMPFIYSGGLQADWAFKFDTLSAVMVFVVSVCSTAIHVYSVGYMHDDPGQPRFMAYLSLFTFCMLMLVTAANLVQMFFGWEGVGLCSYLLVGFWYDRPSAGAAAIKAFIVNRVGDFGFALGIFGVYTMFGTVVFDEVFTAVPTHLTLQLHFLSWDVPALTLVCLLLFVGAMGKSAQMPLHTWLPDAMEGPTPVSALIHAATMVTAGVFMVARLSPMFEYAPDALAVVGIIGATTCIFAASVGLVQTDIKRVIAYSTCSQLGYMFFAAGVSAYAAAIFHLMTHAFFKALLFLGSGSVIHAMSGEQDMRKMGGLWNKIPITYTLMWIGSLALAGIPFFAGYYSKDMIIEAAFANHSPVGLYAFWLGVAAAALTAFYSWRLLFMTFHGAPRADHHVMEHVHESPNVMLIPLYVLALGAVVAGFLGFPYFVGDKSEAFWRGAILVLPNHNSIEAAHHSEIWWVGILPTIVGLIGIGIAYGFYIRDPALPRRLAAQARTLYLFLLNKWYFDEIYDALFVRPSFSLGRGFWKKGDGAIIDGLGPDALAANTLRLARRASLLQTGYIYHYAFAMLIGVVLLVTWYLLVG
ncbi:MAG TPA: NADH-quinone oxidoreductase subunit L [Alphaproteobacteria bacterium]|nr:NADH-quinone oxidoreductase subunit L [Alphaproteobacteria bacterium]